MFKLFKSKLMRMTPQEQLDDIVWNRIKDFDFSPYIKDIMIERSEENIIKIDNNLQIQTRYYIYINGRIYLTVFIFFKDTILDLSRDLEDKIKNLLFGYYSKLKVEEWEQREKYKNISLQKQINLLTNNK